MTEAPTIVRATVGHLPWLRAFFSELQAEQQAAHPVDYPRIGPEDADAFTLSMFRAIDRPSVLLAVAELDVQPVGFLAGEILEREIGAPRKFGHAHYLYVVPSRRKAGIAAALIGYAAAWGTAQGAEVAECYGLAGDDAWARRGFTPLLTRYYVPIAQLGATSATVRDGVQPAVTPRDPVQRPVTPPARGRRRRKKRAKVNGFDETEARHAPRQ